MSSARRPDHGGSAALGVPPAQRIDPGFDSLPGELPPEPSAMDPRPSHLVPCRQCGALNGRSAMVCWGCEADLLALGPFAHMVPPSPPEPVAVPVVPHQRPEPVAVSVVQLQTVVVERDGSANGQRGLHLVSRAGAPVPVPPAPGPALPDFSVELPVLTAQVDDPVPAPVVAKARRPYPLPTIALALAVVVLLLVAAGLRWWGAPPAAVANAPLAGGAVNAAAPERPFAAPVQTGTPDSASLPLPPLEVAPDAAAADREGRTPVRARPPAPARASAKARETRPAAVPTAGVAAPTGVPPRQRNAAPAKCTSNMAALGFCTLEPASSKE